MGRRRSSTNFGTTSGAVAGEGPRRVRDEGFRTSAGSWKIIRSACCEATHVEVEEEPSLPIPVPAVAGREFRTDDPPDWDNGNDPCSREVQRRCSTLGAGAGSPRVVDNEHTAPGRVSAYQEVVIRMAAETQVVAFAG